VAVTRLYLRNIVIAGTLYELTEAQGSGPNTVTGTLNSATYTEVLSWELAGADLAGSSVPTSVVVTGITGTINYRYRVQRVNSGGTVQASSAYSAVYTATGTRTDSLTLATTWAAGDRLRLSLEIQRSGGHGTVDITAQTESATSYIEPDLVVAPVELTGDPTGAGAGASATLAAGASLDAGVAGAAIGAEGVLEEPTLPDIEVVVWGVELNSSAPGLVGEATGAGAGASATLVAGASMAPVESGAAIGAEAGLEEPTLPDLEVVVWSVSLGATEVIELAGDPAGAAIGAEATAEAGAALVSAGSGAGAGMFATLVVGAAMVAGACGAGVGAGAMPVAAAAPVTVDAGAAVGGQAAAEAAAFLLADAAGAGIGAEAALGAGSVLETVAAGAAAGASATLSVGAAPLTEATGSAAGASATLSAGAAPLTNASGVEIRAQGSLGLSIVLETLEVGAAAGASATLSAGAAPLADAAGAAAGASATLSAGAAPLADATGASISAEASLGLGIVLETLEGGAGAGASATLSAGAAPVTAAAGGSVGADGAAAAGATLVANDAGISTSASGTLTTDVEAADLEVVIWELSLTATASEGVELEGVATGLAVGSDASAVAPAILTGEPAGAGLGADGTAAASAILIVEATGAGAGAFADLYTGDMQALPTGLAVGAGASMVAGAELNADAAGAGAGAEGALVAGATLAAEPSGFGAGASATFGGGVALTTDPAGAGAGAEATLVAGATLSGVAAGLSVGSSGALVGPALCTLYTPAMAPGVTVWVRARSEAPGERPSAWSPSSSLIISDAPYIALQQLSLAGGVPTVSWVTSPATAGVRLDYSVQSPGSDPSYTAFVPDFMATQGSAVLSGVVLDPGEEIVVRATPYPTYSAGVASGPAGPSRVARATYLPDGYFLPALSSASVSLAGPGDCALSEAVGVAVNWGTVGTTTGLEVRIYRSQDGGAYTLLADELAVAANPYTEALAGVEVDPAGTVRTLRYRVELYRPADGVTVTSRLTPALTIYLSEC
jgi:hypothetical protein